MKISRANSNERSSQLKKKAKRLAAYSAAAAATLTNANISTNAAEVVWDIPDQTAGITSNLLFNVQTGATATAPLGVFALYNTASASFALNSNNGAGIVYAPIGDTTAGLVGTGGFASIPGYQSSTYFRYASRLALSSNIGIGNSFNGNSGYSSLGNYAFLSQFNDGTPGIVGLRFTLGGSLHYGWAEVSRPSSGGTILHGFGYNDLANTPTHPIITTREILGDFNDDKVLDAADWVIMRDNGFTDLSGETPETSYPLGDIDGDLDIDVNDFDQFRKTFAIENPGSGAFEAMLQSTTVPEPSSMLLLAAGAAGMGAWRKRKTKTTE